MNILALDTTSEFGSFAVRANGRLLAETSLRSSEGFSHLIFPAVEAVLSQAGTQLEQIDCFAAASGPGSFTGVRVGLSAVKGLAEALGKSAAGISNLRAMSWFGYSERRAVMLDARRGEIFAAVYDANLQLLSPERVIKLSSWLDTLTLPLYEFVSFADSSFRSALAGTRFASMPFTEAPRNLASAIARCAELDGRKGKWQDPAALDANYVRRSDAELFWKDP